MALVLIVDDEFSIAKLLEDVLTDEGHRVLIAGNGKQALEIAAQETPAIVMTDYMMPVMDGATLVNRMAADTKLKAVPVILMSSLPEQTVADHCAGYATFIRKPFKILDVVDLIARHLAAEG